MGWVVKATPRWLYPKGRDQLPSEMLAGWVPETSSTGAENLAWNGIRSTDRLAVASRYTDFASDSQNVLRGPQVLRDHFTGGSWMHLCNSYFESHLLFKIKKLLFKIMMELL